MRDFFPAQHQRAPVHGFAGQHLVVVVHHARAVGGLAPRHHGAGLHHDADEITVPVEQLERVAHRLARRAVHVQQRQTSLRSNRQGHGVGEHQVVGAVEFFFRQEVGAQQAQAVLLGAVECAEERVGGKRGLPQRVGHRRGLAQRAWQQALQQIDHGKGKGMRRTPWASSRSTSARGGWAAASQSLSTMRCRPSPSA